MIEHTRDQTTPDPVRIKIVGIGGAGSNALDRLVLDGVQNADLIAINTDAQSLTQSVANEKVQLGRSVTRGLGAGGDPEVGAAAAEEGIDEIRQALEGAGMVFICVGLGGGTGSGAAPIVAHIARQQQSLVVAFATMPFTFEGKRRGFQATEALASLHEQANAVICFENDRLGDAVSPKAGIHEAFATCDQTISQSVRAVCDLFQRPGLIHIGFDDLSSALRNHDPRCLFAHGESTSDNRAHEALERALKSPLMDRGRMLNEAGNVLVNIAGGPSMTLSEVQILMDALGRHLNDETRVLFGAAVDPKLGERMSVTIISSVGVGEAPAREPAPRERPARLPEPPPVEVPEAVENSDESDVLDQSGEPAPPAPGPANQPAPPAPLEAAKPAPKPKPKAHETQETLQFEPVTRGRFEKSEPTIVDGQDLDVPTFMRRNVKVK